MGTVKQSDTRTRLSKCSSRFRSPPLDPPPLPTTSRGFRPGGTMHRNQACACFSSSTHRQTQQLTSHSFALDVTVKCTSACVLFRSVITAKADQQVDEGRGGVGVGGGLKVGVSQCRPLQMNLHTSSSIILKSSVSERQQLLKVWQGLLRPRYKFSSTHSPKWPLHGTEIFSSASISHKTAIQLQANFLVCKLVANYGLCILISRYLKG